MSTMPKAMELLGNNINKMNHRKQKPHLTIPGFHQMNNQVKHKEILRSISFSEENSEAFVAYDLDPLLTRTSPKHAFVDMATPTFQNIEPFGKRLEKLSIEKDLDIQEYNTDEYQMQPSHINTVKESLRRKTIEIRQTRKSIIESAKDSLKITDPDEEGSRLFCTNQEISCRCSII